MTKSLIKQVVKQLFNRMGYEVRKAGTVCMGTSPLTDAVTLLPDTDSERTLFDVGANSGQTAHQLLELFPTGKIYCFEPGNQAFKQLKNRLGDHDRVQVNQTAASNKNGEITFYESHHTDMSSTVELSTHYKSLITRETSVPCETIDSFTTRHGIEHISLLKSDTQGADMAVLEGAQALISSGKIDLVLTELLFHDVYRTKSEVDVIYRFLRDRGYRLVSFYPPHFRGNCVGFLDALFIHESHYNGHRL